VFHLRDTQCFSDTTRYLYAIPAVADSSNAERRTLLSARENNCSERRRLQ